MSDRPLHPRIPNFGVDQRIVCRMATEHLAQQGCKNIAHLKVTEARFDGYRAGLKSSGLPFRPKLVYEAAHFTYEMGEQAVAHFTKHGIEIDGIVAQSDLQALGAMHALLKMNKRIPQDVRITGVDNSPFCQFSIVPLTSISQEESARGELAVRYLLNAVSAEGNTDIIPAVEPRLLVRDSSAGR
jgi:LacI family transcriptional regulator